MLRALKKWFGNQPNKRDYTPSKIFAMQLLTERVGDALEGAGIRVDDRDISEYLAELRGATRKWALSFGYKDDGTYDDESQKLIKYWNELNDDGIYKYRAERILHEPSKLQTQARLLARWGDSKRLNSVIVYMQLVEYELNMHMNNLELARLKTK
jgi:hypothetical protein